MSETGKHPQELGRYRVRRVLGRGAMGVVYLGEDPVIGRQVAVKVIQVFVGVAEEEMRLRQDRFEREFRSAGSLSHPNIVTVYDVGKEGDASFIAMEYVPGETLEDVIDSGRHLTLGEAAELARSIAGALDYAHERDIVHRDIKPGNILLTPEGVPKLSDFGVAKLNTAQATMTGTVIGTPAYMSPEQITGDPITGASDQFSLAVLLYQVLTGERPFAGDNPTTMMYRIIHRSPTPPRQLNGSLPEAVDTVLLKAMAKDPAERFGSCSAFAEALARALGAAPARGREGPDVDPAAATALFERVELDLGRAADPAEIAEERPRGRGRRGAMAAGIVALLLAAAAGWLVWRGEGPAAGGEAGAAGEVERGVEVVSTPPGAEVFVDGVDQGMRTPALVTLRGERGRVVEVELRRDGETAARTQMILGDEAGGRWAPELPPPPERLTVASTPAGARVVFDGEPVAGAAPVELRFDPEREHTLELALDGHRTVRRTLRWPELPEEARSARRLDVELAEIPPPGFLAVAASYPFEIAVDGQRRSGERIEVEPGRHRLSVSAPSVFYSDVRTVDVAPGETVRISLPPAHRVAVAATPSNCRVRIDGRDVGFVPLEVELAQGGHEIEFVWEALGKTVRRTADVGPGTGRIFAAAGDA